MPDTDTEVDVLRLLNKPKFDYQDIEELVEREQKENINLDYKSGEWLIHNEGGKRKIRKWVTAFANSAGGLLVLGVPERKIDEETIIPSSPDGIEKGNFGEHGVAKWIEDCLKEKIVPRLIPPPKIFSFDHPDDSDKVIVVVQTRETTLPLLHSIREGKDIRYYHRHNFQVIQMDEWEVRAMLIGRTRAPLLKLSCRGVRAVGFDGDPPKGQPGNLSIRLSIQNESLTVAKFIHVGLVVPHPISAHFESPRDGNDSPAVQTNVIPEEIKEKFNVLEERLTVETITYLKRFLSPLGTLEMEIVLGIRDVTLHQSSIGIFLVAEGMIPKSYHLTLNPKRGIVPYPYREGPVPYTLKSENDIECALPVFSGSPAEDREAEHIPPECFAPER